MLYWELEQQVDLKPYFGTSSELFVASAVSPCQFAAVVLFLQIGLGQKLINLRNIAILKI